MVLQIVYGRSSNKVVARVMVKEVASILLCSMESKSAIAFWLRVIWLIILGGSMYIGTAVKFGRGVEASTEDEAFLCFRVRFNLIVWSQEC